MWFKLIPLSADFTASSPHKMAFDALVEAPPSRVFDIFTKGEGQETWFQDFRACLWTSSAPHGVGATREIQLKMLSVRERFVTWDPGARVTFSVDAITMPLVRRMMEDLQFLPAGEKRTRLVWTVHYEPALLMKLVHPVAKLVFGQMFRASIDGLVKYANAHAAG